jgi:PAS domain S-box-containing protein
MKKFSEAFIPDEIDRLNEQIESLSRQLQSMQQEKSDLEILLETITIHSDQTIDDIQQEKSDLEILLETMTEHSDTVTLELKHQADEERRQREEQFQLITEATPVSVLVARISDGEVLYANETTGTMFAAPTESLIHQKTTRFYCNPADRAKMLTAVKREGRFQGEIQLKKVDETPFWALMSVRPFIFQGENVFLTAVYDITDRKRAEEALRIAEAKYRGIFENAIEGIFQATPEGQYLDVNPAMAALFGYESPAEMIQKVTCITEQIYVDPALRQEFVRAIESQGEIKDFEYQAHRQDGSIFWVSERSREVRDDNGNLLFYEGSCIDITRRKEEEEALKRQVQELQIEIDQAKREREVSRITQSDYFQWLMEEADSLRQEDFWEEGISEKSDEK